MSPEVWHFMSFQTFMGHSLPPRCTSGSNLINSVKMLRLHIRFLIYVSKMHLFSQRGCNLQSASMRSNTAIRMITVACALKSFLNRGFIMVFHKLYIILFPISPIQDEKRGNVIHKVLWLRPIFIRIFKTKLLMVSIEPLSHV